MNATVAQSPASETKPRWLALLLLCLVYTIHSIDRTSFNVLLEPISREFLLSDRDLGLIAGFVYVVPFALASIPLGILVDRTNRKNLVAVILACWSSATMLAGLATGFVSLATARAAVGAAEAGTPPTCLSLLADLFPVSLRPTAVSIFYIGAPLGVLIGSTLAGGISHAFGWRVALMALGLPGVILAIFVVIFFKEPTRTVQLDETSGTLRSAFTWMRQPAVLLAVAALIVASMVVLGAGTWIAIFLVRTHHVSIAKVGGVVGLILGLGGIVGSLAGGILARRLAAGRDAFLPVISGTALILAAPFLMAALLAPSYSAAVLTLVPFGILSAAYYGPAYGLCLNLAPAKIRGRVVSIIFILTNVVGGGLGPYLVGTASLSLTRTQHGAPLALAMSMLPILALLAGGLFLASARLLKRMSD